MTIRVLFPKFSVEAFNITVFYRSARSNIIQLYFPALCPHFARSRGILRLGIRGERFRNISLCLKVMQRIVFASRGLF